MGRAGAVLEFLLVISFYNKISMRLSLENFAAGKNVCRKKGKKKERFTLIMVHYQGLIKA